MIHFPSTKKVVALSMLILHMVLTDITTVKGDPDTTRLDGECGSETWNEGDPYGTLVEQMLNELPVDCANDPNHVKFSEYSSGDIVAYGSASCTADLSGDDCQSCLATAQENLLTDCPFYKSAWVQLVDCYMGYSDTP